MHSIDQSEGHGPSLPSAYKPPTPARSLKRSISQQFKKSISLTSEDMRAFSIKGRHAVNFSLTGVSMPSIFSSRRAPPTVPVSEPVSPQRTPASLPPLPDESEIPPPPVAKTDDTFEISVQKPSPRAPSPTPTEVLEPEPEDIEEQLEKYKIKVRDFAYEENSPRAAEEEDPDNPFSTITTASSSKDSSKPRFPPAAEIFDQYKGIVEYEYRLGQAPRTIPITGKVLRRLLDIRWVTMEEAKARLHQMDWEAMKIYEAKSADYPWRPCRFSQIPDAAGRAQLLAERGNWFAMVDRMRMQMEAHAAWEAVQAERERRAVEEAQERIRQMEAERQGGMGMIIDAEDDMEDEPLVNGYAPVGSSSTVSAPIAVTNGPTTPRSSPPREDPMASPSGKKRSLEHSISTPSFSTSPSTSTGPKRVRLESEDKPLPVIPPSEDTTASAKSTLNASPSRTGAYMLPPGLTPPAQQYPAPLSTYDPNKYPDAARVIQETRAMVSAQDEDQSRSDTPPLEDEEEGASWKNLGKQRGGIPLQRKKKGTERSLSRTQTYRQL